MAASLAHHDIYYVYIYIYTYIHLHIHLHISPVDIPNHFGSGWDPRIPHRHLDQRMEDKDVLCGL